jgi:hypothetical protein
VREDGDDGATARIGGGEEGNAAIEGSEGGGVARERLYSRQHVGHRHSTTRVPSESLYRARRQPNRALMRV